MIGLKHFISLDLRILNKILTEVSLYILKVICFAMSRSLDRLGETHTFIKRISNSFTSKKKRTSVIYLWTYQKLLIVLKFSVYRKSTNNVKQLKILLSDLAPTFLTGVNMQRLLAQYNTIQLSKCYQTASHFSLKYREALLYDISYFLLTCKEQMLECFYKNKLSNFVHMLTIQI